MTTETKDRTSILANLTAEVMQDKKAEARKLTPVGNEKGALLERALIPNDTGKFMSNEVLYGHAKELRKFAADAIAIADGLDALLVESTDPGDVVDLDAERKTREAAADEKFAADFAAKQAEAQAATFVDPADEADPPLPPEEPTFDWLCPEHGKAIEKTSPKTQRTFIGCPDCNLFKR